MEKIKTDDEDLIEKTLNEVDLNKNDTKNNKICLDDENKNSNNCTQISVNKHTLFNNEMEGLISKSYTLIGENVRK